MRRREILLLRRLLRGGKRRTGRRSTVTWRIRLTLVRICSARLLAKRTRVGADILTQAGACLQRHLSRDGRVF